MRGFKPTAIYTLKMENGICKVVKKEDHPKKGKVILQSVGGKHFNVVYV